MRSGHVLGAPAGWIQPVRSVPCRQGKSHAMLPVAVSLYLTGTVTVCGLRRQHELYRLCMGGVQSYQRQPRVHEVPGGQAYARRGKSSVLHRGDQLSVWKVHTRAHVSAPHPWHMPAHWRVGLQYSPSACINTSRDAECVAGIARKSMVLASTARLASTSHLIDGRWHVKAAPAVRSVLLPMPAAAWCVHQASGPYRHKTRTARRGRGRETACTATRARRPHAARRCS
jgi:hypothetical protein